MIKPARPDAPASAPEPTSAAARHEQLRQALGEAVQRSKTGPRPIPAQRIKKSGGTGRGTGRIRQVNEKVGRFEVLHALGHGGMGDVYFARDERLDREVAIKILRVREPIARARFERGARAMARISHPNVVSLHEIGDDAGCSYIVMEYIEGATLREWIEAGPRPLPEVLATFMAAGEGLAAAHDGGLVHRDFKPSNVMLGQDGRVLVTDFGLARGGPSIGDEDLSHEMRVAGLLTGTPAYMAPEQFSGDEVDARSDQFSFCVALWEAVYGARPFQAPNIQSLAAVVHTGQPKVPDGARAPKWLRRTLERGLAVDPTKRWPSMRALLDALATGLGRRRWLAWATR